LRQAEREFFPHLAVIGVHSGKFTREGETAGIAQAMQREGIAHAVVNDADMRVWQGYGVRAWPTLVLIDARGRVVARQEGELPYRELQARLRQEIAAAAAAGLLTNSPPPAAADVPTGGELRFPGGIALGPDHTIYIADSAHHRVLAWRRQDGIVKAWGDATPGHADGGPSACRLRDPHGLAVSGGSLFVADSGNHALRRIDLASGAMTTMNKRPDDAWEAPLGGSQLRSPWDVAADEEGLFIAAAGNHQIWRLDFGGGRLAPYAGSGYEALYDAELPRARLAQPMAIAVAGQKVFVADAESSAVRVMPARPPGRVQTLVGRGLFDFGSRQGPFAGTLLQHPQGLALLNGDLYVADTYNDQVVRLDLGRATSAVALSHLSEPSALVADPQSLYIVDSGHHRLLRWAPGAKEAELLLG
jgi:sugar lactone lactonase YvrE